MAAPSPAAAATPKLGRPAHQRFVTVLLATAVWGGILFASAGRIDWWRGWIELGLFLGCLIVTGVIVARKNPEVLNQRVMKHPYTKPFDKVVGPLYTLLNVALAVVAGLDAGGFGYSTGAETLYIGAALFLAGNVPSVRAMAVNPFLETTVRIQTDRGHKVVAAGPYAFVRHPMYVGIILQSLATPLVLGSRWAFVPAGLAVVLFVVRTALEDRTLRRELPGYEAFTQNARYRLLPGVF